MHTLRSLASIAGAGTAAAIALSAAPSAAGAADLSVDVYRPVYVAPAPRVYVAQAHVVTVGPNCVTRTTRVWVGDHYARRTVRRCF